MPHMRHLYRVFKLQVVSWTKNFPGSASEGAITSSLRDLPHISSVIRENEEATRLESGQRCDVIARTGLGSRENTICVSKEG